MIFIILNNCLLNNVLTLYGEIWYWSILWIKWLNEMEFESKSMLYY